MQNVSKTTKSQWKTVLSADAENIYLLMAALDEVDELLSKAKQPRQQHSPLAHCDASGLNSFASVSSRWLKLPPCCCCFCSCFCSLLLESSAPSNDRLKLPRRSFQSPLLRSPVLLLSAALLLLLELFPLLLLAAVGLLAVTTCSGNGSATAPQCFVVELLPPLPAPVAYGPLVSL